MGRPAVIVFLEGRLSKGEGKGCGARVEGVEEMVNFWERIFFFFFL